jgi:hypothetical protein
LKLEKRINYIERFCRKRASTIYSLLRNFELKFKDLNKEINKRIENELKIFLCEDWVHANCFIEVVDEFLKQFYLFLNNYHNTLEHLQMLSQVEICNTENYHI